MRIMSIVAGLQGRTAPQATGEGAVFIFDTGEQGWGVEGEGGGLFGHSLVAAEARSGTGVASRRGHQSLGRLVSVGLRVNYRQISR